MKFADIGYTEDDVNYSGIPDIPEFRQPEPPSFLKGLIKNDETTPLLPEPDLLGAGKAIGLGIARGGVSLLRTANDVMDGFDSLTGIDPEEKPAVDLNKMLNVAADATELNPDEYGGGGQLLHGIASFATRSVGGATTLFATGADEQFRKNKKEGVDLTTNIATSIYAGGTDALFGKLPMGLKVNSVAATLLREAAEGTGSATLKTIANSFASGIDNVAKFSSKSRLNGAVYGATLNVGTGATSRGLISETLDANGYPELAKQYAPVDGAAIMGDAVLGSLFGFFHSNAPDGKATEARSDIPPSTIHDALQFIRDAENARGGVGIPTDHSSVSIDTTFQKAAMDHLENGTPLLDNPDAANYLREHTIEDPQKTEHEQVFSELSVNILQQHGIKPEDFDYDPPESDVQFQQPITPTEGEVKYPTSEKLINPLDLHNLDQISRSNPDMLIESPDGKFIKASDYMAHMEEDLALTHKESEAIDAAIACILRVEP